MFEDLWDGHDAIGGDASCCRLAPERRHPLPVVPATQRDTYVNVYQYLCFYMFIIYIYVYIVF